jgi:23S rRNA pseudouridine1911/1915/1917 synthase
MAKKNETREFKVHDENTLLEYLYKVLDGYTKKKVKSLLVHGNILVNGKSVTQYNMPLKTGDTITVVFGHMVYETKGQVLPIIYEDHELIVINKPAGLLTVSTETEKGKTAYHMVREHVKKNNPREKVFIVHRLDRDTSGVLLFAKSLELKEQLQEHWNTVVKVRSYIAIVEGIDMPSKGTVVSYLKENRNKMVYSTNDTVNGKKAITHYKKMKEAKNYTLLEVQLETGRKNQIRVAMADLNHPIIGDKKYGSEKNPIGRLGLHAGKIMIQMPHTKKNLKFTVPTPEIFMKLFH